MVDPQTSRFWQAALQSGLIDREGLQACWEALPQEKRVADQLDRRLARQAVQANLLTLWQAQQLLAGRSTGFKIDRYILLEMIGQGGMGRVYLAKDSRLNRRVAVKILSPERVNNPRAIARFQREARVGAQLQHENLVRIYDEGESAGKCYLVMEFIEGKNLGAVIAESGPMPPSTAARLTRQVALGLEHAQQKGLIHRDVNPYNILVTRDGTAKLTDLGLAIDLAEEGQVTRDGATVGTFDYVSPEQARHSHSVDTRSDIYSLGCTLYHILCGQVPFPSPSLPEKLFGHQAVEPEALESLAPGVPESLGDVVRKMMAKQPEQRYSNPLEVAQALEAFVDDQATAYRETPSIPTQPHFPRDVQTVTRTRIAPSQPPLAAVPISPIGSGDEPTPVVPPVPSLPPELAAIAEAPPANPANDFAALGLNLDAEPSRSAQAPSARPRGERSPDSSPTVEIPTHIKSSPAPAVSSAPAGPAPALEETLDFSKIGANEPAGEDFSALGLTLDFGSPSTRAEKPAPAKPKPPEPVEKPTAAASPAPTPAAKPVPAPALPVTEEFPDFLKIGGESPSGRETQGVNLGLDFGSSAPSPTPAPPQTRSKPAEAPSKPVAADPPAPAPVAKSKRAPAPAPAPEELPDFLKIGGETPSHQDALGVNLGLDFGEGPSSPAPATPPAKPKPAKPPETPAKPAAVAPPATAPPPAPVAKPKAVAPAPVPEELPDFLKIGGEAPSSQEAQGVNLGLDFGEAPVSSPVPAPPPAKPKPAKAPEAPAKPAAAAPPVTTPAPAPAAMPKPAPAVAPVPEELPDFLKIGGETPSSRQETSGVNLGLDFGAGDASPAAAVPQARAKAPEPKAKPVAEAPTAASVAPVAKVKPAAPAAPLPPTEDFPDFSKIGAQTASSSEPSGLNLGLDLGLAATQPESPPKSKPKAVAEAPKPKPPAAVPAPAPPVAPAPVAKTKPPAAPTPAPPADDMPDFSKIGGTSSSPSESAGFNLGLNFDAAPSAAQEPPKAKPKPAAEPAKTKPAPQPAPAVAPAPAAKAKPVSPAPAASAPAASEAPFDFSKIGGSPSPADDSAGLGLGLNFGPAPSLAETTSKPKPAPKAPVASAPAPAPEETPAAPKAVRQGLDRRLVLGGAAALVLLALGGGLFATGFFSSSGGSPADKAKAKPAPAVTSNASTEKTPEKAPEPAPKASEPEIAAVTPKVVPKPVEVPKGQSFAVKTPDGTVTVEPSFKSAMQRAIGSKGHVLLNNSEPIRFSGDNAALRISGGRLYIRAAEGVHPVLEVDMKGPEAFLTTSAETSIVMAGVTIVAHYGPQTKEAPPVFEVGGNIQLEQCALSATGAVKGSRALLVDGGRVAVSGCWFQGFDRTIDMAVIGGSSSSIKQSIIVRGKMDDSSIGWALRVRKMLGGGTSKNPRTLLLDHCTFQGEGMIDLVEFSPQAPYKVVVKNCAVSANALMAWEPTPKDVPLDNQSLLWSGEGNQYDIRGKAWAVSSIGAPPADLAGAPTDLTSWTKIGAESASIPPPIKFQTDPTTLSESPRPADFAVQGTIPVGADPKLVGP